MRHLRLRSHNGFKVNEKAYYLYNFSEPIFYKHILYIDEIEITQIESIKIRKPCIRFALPNYLYKCPKRHFER